MLGKSKRRSAEDGGAMAPAAFRAVTAVGGVPKAGPSPRSSARRAAGVPYVKNSKMRHSCPDRLLRVAVAAAGPDPEARDGRTFAAVRAFFFLR